MSSSASGKGKEDTIPDSSWAMDSASLGVLAGRNQYDAAGAPRRGNASWWHHHCDCHGVSLGQFWKYNNFHLRISLWILLRPPVARYGEAAIVWPRATCL